MKNVNLCTKNIPRAIMRSIAAALMGIMIPHAALAAPIYGLLETDTPLQTAGVIRGNLPLPPGFLSAAETYEKFGVIDSDGSVRTAQTDIVTRHPDGSVAIVELTAAVAGTASQGEAVGRYKVTSLATPEPKRPTQGGALRKLGVVTKLEPEVKMFLTKKTLVFIATGPFNELYACNMFMVQNQNIKTYKDGYTENTIGLPCDLKPVDGFNINNHKEIPQILTVIAFVTTTSGSPVIKLDMLYGNTRVANGAYVGKTYFKDLKLAVPEQFVVVNDVPVPSYNPTPQITDGYAVYDIIKPMADNTHHVAPTLTWHMRKLAITTPTHLAKAGAELRMQGQAFAKKAVYAGDQTFNWENPATANYALGEALPDLSFAGFQNIKNKINGQWNGIKSNLTTGAVVGGVTFVKGVLGHTDPWGVQYGGMTGGTEIEMIPPAAGALAGAVNSIRVQQYILGAYLDRHHDIFATQANGEPWAVEKAVVNCTSGGGPTGKAQDMQFLGHVGTPTKMDQNDHYGILASSVYNYHRNAANVPLYEGILLTYSAIDYQHLVRLTSKLYFLIDMKNDPIAKYILRGVAENIRATQTMYSKTGNCIPLYGSLLNYYNHVNINPGAGKGVGIGRAEADTFHAVAESYAAGDDAWRNTSRYWLNTAADIMTKAQVLCSGFIMARDVPSGKGLQPPFDTQNNKISQSIESARLSQTLEVFYNKVFKGYDDVRATKVRNAQNLYIANLINPAYMLGNNIAHFVHVYDSNTGQVTCPNNLQAGMVTGNGNWEMPNDLLRGWDRTGNVVYLNVANGMMSYSPVLLNDLQDKFKPSADYWESWASTALDLEQKRLGY